MSKTIKLKGEININNIDGFEQYISEFGPKSRVSHSSLVCLEDGSFEIHVLMPNIRECEIYAFQNNPVKFYRKEFPGGIISTSIRGIASFDTVYIPFSAGTSLEKAKKQNSVIQAYLIDTATDEIKGYRRVKVPERIISQIIDDWKTMEHKGFQSFEIHLSMQQHIFPYTPKEFMKRSLYIGRECEDLTPDVICFFGKKIA